MNGCWAVRKYAMSGAEGGKALASKKGTSLGLTRRMQERTREDPRRAGIGSGRWSWSWSGMRSLLVGERRMLRGWCGWGQRSGEKLTMSI